MPETKQVETQKRTPVRKFFKSFVDVKKWSSYDEVSSNAKTTLNLFRRLIFRGRVTARQETYDEAIVRLGLNEEQLTRRKNNFLYATMVYGAFVLAFLFYFFYLLFHLRLLAACLILIPLALMLLVTYREHFWYMQMQKKKLGCNFNEWLAFVLRRSI